MDATPSHPDTPVNVYNVYKGSDSIRDYHNPDKAPPLPLVELPPHVNPFYDHGVRIYAKMMTSLPAHNVKALPALNLLLEHKKPNTRSIVEYSSGSTVISLAILSQVLYGITDTWAYVSNKTHLTKLRLLQFFGLKVKLFGGPSTPDPKDDRGGIRAAERAQAQDESVLNPNQYISDANWKAHTLWTGPQILKQLPEIGIFCAALGTTGTMSGVGTFLKQARSSIRCLGVCIAPGNEVPGPRMFSMIRNIMFPWREVVDDVEDVGTRDSFVTSIQLCREGIVCGPSSGLGFKGLTRYLERQISDKGLDVLKGPDGLLHCVFMCCDLPYQYLDEYHKILGSEYFTPIVNENLLTVDRYTYDSQWELSPADCADWIGTNSKGLRAENVEEQDSASDVDIFDLRSAADFERGHIPRSKNLPLHSLLSESVSPFSNADILESQWKEMEDELVERVKKNRPLLEPYRSPKCLLICYNGDTARVATSILRAKKIEAFSLGGGFRGLG